MKRTSMDNEVGIEDEDVINVYPPTRVGMNSLYVELHNFNYGFKTYDH